MRVSDWSSDVCSSELQFVPAVALAPIVESVDVDKQTLWRRSLVEFDDETVGAAVAELNRYSATQIVVADSRVAAMRSEERRVGKSVSVRVDLGCRRILKKNTQIKQPSPTQYQYKDSILLPTHSTPH